MAVAITETDPDYFLKEKARILRFKTLSEIPLRVDRIQKGILETYGDEVFVDVFKGFLNSLPLSDLDHKDNKQSELSIDDTKRLLDYELISFKVEFPNYVERWLMYNNLWGEKKLMYLLS